MGVNVNRIPQKLSTPRTQLVVAGAESLVLDIHLPQAPVILLAVLGIKHRQPLPVQVAGLLCQFPGGIAALKGGFQRLFKLEAWYKDKSTNNLIYKSRM